MCLLPVCVSFVLLFDAVGYRTVCNDINVLHFYIVTIPADVDSLVRRLATPLRTVQRNKALALVDSIVNVVVCVLLL